MRSISLVSSTGITAPFIVEVCTIFWENCETVGVFGSSVPFPPPLTINLPSSFDTYPLILIKITDSKGCISTYQLGCEDNVLFCDITYNIT